MTALTELQGQLEKVELERDAARHQEQEVKAELVAFQQAAIEREAALKAACPPPESGCSVNVSFTVNDDGTILTGGQLTLRADKYEQALDVLAYLSHLMAERKWKVSPAPKPAPAAKENNKAVAILKEAGATPQVIAAVTQATAHVKPVLEIHAVYMTIEPKAGGKINVNFFGNDRKQPHNQFADIYYTRTLDQLKKDMPFLAPETYENADEFTVDLVVGYTLSDKPNTKGNPYKDIQYIKSA